MDMGEAFAAKFCARRMQHRSHSAFRAGTQSNGGIRVVPKPASAQSIPPFLLDLDGTLVDTAPDLINALNFVLDREGLPPVPLQSARNMIGAGARKLIERGLELEGRVAGVDDISRLTADFIDYYAAHIADASRPFDGLENAPDALSGILSGRNFGKLLVRVA